MSNYIKAKLIELKDSIMGEADEMGGIHIFLMALVITLFALPFLLLYYFILIPFYKFIRMLIDSIKIGPKMAYMKYFRSDEYEKRGTKNL